MADVTNPPADSLDVSVPDKTTSSSPLPPPSNQEQLPQEQQPPNRRERDSRERRDDKDLERPPNRRDRSPPPPPRRDYKRRPSGSPPPPYRDNRRFSPPPRRSPPHKRYRRDDNGYDNRRGSPPRGGYGPPDRRFEYDHGGGYDREMGGRPGYGDDRPHGRFMGRYQGDWKGGRGGYGDTSNSGSTQRDGLMSYKQFIQELEDDILPSEAERRYKEYKSGYVTTQKRVYFNTHKEEEWLKDKYHPTNLLSVIDRRNELARKVASDFLLDLQSGALDLGPALTSTNKSSRTSEKNSEDEEAGGGKRRRNARGEAKETDLSAAPKAPGFSSDPKRFLTDIEQAQALVRKLDSEKGIQENFLSGSENEKSGRDKPHSGSTGPVIIIRGLTSVKGLEGVELLDTLVTYLWRVHGVDYYGMVETNEAKGLRHVRAERKVSDAKGDESESKFDTYWQERLKGQDPLETMAAKEKLDAAALEALDPHVRKIRDEKYGWKYGCGAKGCTKLFHAAEFVHKHLKLKHTELVVDSTGKVREELYFQNYMNDPNAPGGQPPIQQSGPRDRPMRRRPGMENRLRDDRGGHRERDVRGNGNDRIDRSENQQRGDGDGPDGENPEEAGYNAFGGQGGVHVPSFSSDINPPPVLMPVPGAGPLGPFVPAPAEFAMQMFRDPNGPNPSFEGSGSGGPAPFLMSSAFRQDPRRLRSYQDLDAMEEEVTVIDYRSL